MLKLLFHKVLVPGVDILAAPSGHNYMINTTSTINIKGSSEVFCDLHISTIKIIDTD